MTVHQMHFINKEKVSLRWTNDDSSTASSEAEITTNTPLKTKLEPVICIRKSGKSTRFAEENEYYEIDHIDDIDKEEVAKAWYTKREYATIRADYSLTVRIMSTVQCFDETEEHCPRGLEYRTPLGSQKRQANKWIAIEAVLEEQQRQQVEGIYDDEYLSQVYIQAAPHCQQEALERGLADADAAAYLSCCMADPSLKRSPHRSSRSVMRNPSARRRAVLEDLQQMLSGTHIVRN